ncbi:MAG: hypothetical protein RRY23_00180 [Alistipes sp.]
MSRDKRHNFFTDLTYLETFYERKDDGSLVITTIPADEVDFTLEYYVDGRSRFRASRKAGKYENCKKVDSSTIEVYLSLSRVFLGKGELRRNLFLHFPDKNFQKAIKQVCVPTYTGYYLWEGPSDKGPLSSQGEAVVDTIVKYTPTFVPQTRMFKYGAMTMGLTLAEPCPASIQAQLYIGVFHKSKGEWSLSFNIAVNKDTYDTGNYHITKEQYPNILARLNAYQQKFNVAPVPFQQGIGRYVLTDLFKLEFIPISELGEVREENGRSTERTDYLVYTRQLRKLWRGVSRHNPSGFFIKENNNTNFYILIDKTYKGAKQVINRDYKIGLVRPRRILSDGRPDWSGYSCSNLHEVLVVCRTTGRPQENHNKVQTELYVELK